MNEEKEQLGPISILECPFQDVVMTPDSHQKGKFTDFLEYSYQVTCVPYIFFTGKIYAYCVYLKTQKTIYITNE